MSILTRVCSLAIVLINIQKSPSFLVALFAVCCIIFIKTSPKCVVPRLHINNRQKNTKYDMKHLLQKYKELHCLRTVSSKLPGGGLKDILHCAQFFALDLELFSLKPKLSQTFRVCGQMQKCLFSLVFAL